jgi:hypothetical protein
MSTNDNPKKDAGAATTETESLQDASMASSMQDAAEDTAEDSPDTVRHAPAAARVRDYGKYPTQSLRSSSD